MYEYEESITTFNIYYYLRTFKIMSSPCFTRIVSSLAGLFFHVLFLFNANFFFPSSLLPNWNLTALKYPLESLFCGRKPQGELPPEDLLDAFLTWRGRTDACRLWPHGLLLLVHLQRSASLVI